MKKDPLFEIFTDKAISQLDCELPNIGHAERFQQKLENQFNIKKPKVINVWQLMTPIIAIAAMVLLFLGFVFVNTYTNRDVSSDLADVSEEMSKTQDFFSLAITNELAKIENKRTPETEKLINDAMEQLALLEDDYRSLQKDLNSSGNDKRVIYAMISNFQSRIALLQSVLKNINQLNNFKNDRNEITAII